MKKSFSGVESLLSEQSFFSGDIFIDDSEEGHLSLKNYLGHSLAYVSYNLEGENLCIAGAESFEKNKGYFSKLFDKLLDLAYESNVRYINLEVDENNYNAYKIYEKYGFFCNPNAVVERGFIGMIKYL